VGFYKAVGISGLAEELLASQEGLCFVDTDCHNCVTLILTPRRICECTDSKNSLLKSLQTCPEVRLYLFSTTDRSLLRLIVRSGLDFPTFATRRLHAAEGGTVGEKCPGILPKCRLTHYI